MGEQLNIDDYRDASGGDATYWSNFVGDKVIITGVDEWTDQEGKEGVAATIKNPVEWNGNKYTVLRTTWQVVVKDLKSTKLQAALNNGAELPVVAKKAEGKKYYALSPA